MGAGAFAPVLAEGSSDVSTGPRTRRRWFSGCALFLVFALLLLPLGGFLIVLRSNTFQTGSGIADGVELHPTPVAPLVQRTTALPNKTPQPTATPQTKTNTPNRPPDPQATPSPRTHPTAPTPTAAPRSTGQPTPTTAIVPTPVPTQAQTTGPTAVPQPTATTPAQPATPTATLAPPTPTATAVIASAGTLTFTDQSQQVSNPADMSGCPSGCTFGTQPVSGGTQEATTWNASGYQQTTLSGTVTVTMVCAGSAPPCLFPVYVGAVYGGSYGCTVDQTLTHYGQYITVNCSINTSSPSFLPANTISGTALFPSEGGNNQEVSYTSSAFQGSGYHYVTQGDCQNALAYVEDQGWAWVQNTWNSAANGNIVARSYSDSEYNQSCPQGAIVANDIFNVSVDASISNGLIYNPSGPSNAAQAELNGAIPAGWNVPYRSAACYPTTVGVSVNNVTASCQDSALATYPWSQGDMNGLAQAVAGQSLSQAASTCNGWAHVAGNCKASSNAGGSMPPPASWQSITITPQNPPNPFGGADVGGPSLPATALLGTPVLPFLSLFLLGVGCVGVLRRRQVHPGRKAVL